ncbi:hypothetical protein DL98DRAFT_633791 [Cadophora sp. DSE1049]|nr:hypothetical protein DL98DRAFT_633791 [Cadophora sp. DSE1049]
MATELPRDALEQIAKLLKDASTQAAALSKECDSSSQLLKSKLHESLKQLDDMLQANIERRERKKLFNTENLGSDYDSEEDATEELEDAILKESTMSKNKLKSRYEKKVDDIQQSYGHKASHVATDLIDKLVEVVLFLGTHSAADKIHVTRTVLSQSSKCTATQPLVEHACLSNSKVGDGFKISDPKKNKPEDRGNIDKLKDGHAKEIELLKNSNRSLTAELTESKSEITKLHTQLDDQQPFADVGIKIRIGFIRNLQSNTIEGERYRVWSDQKHSGIMMKKYNDEKNDASHRGNFLADHRLFLLGKISGEELRYVYPVDGPFEFGTAVALEAQKFYGTMVASYIGTKFSFNKSYDIRSRFIRCKMMELWQHMKANCPMDSGTIAMPRLG